MTSVAMDSPTVSADPLEGRVRQERIIVLRTHESELHDLMRIKPQPVEHIKHERENIDRALEHLSTAEFSELAGYFGSQRYGIGVFNRSVAARKVIPVIYPGVTKKEVDAVMDGVSLVASGRGGYPTLIGETTVVGPTVRIDQRDRARDMEAVQAEQRNLIEKIREANRRAIPKLPQ